MWKENIEEIHKKISKEKKDLYIKKILEKAKEMSKDDNTRTNEKINAK